MRGLAEGLGHHVPNLEGCDGGDGVTISRNYEGSVSLGRSSRLGCVSGGFLGFPGLLAVNLGR